MRDFSIRPARRKSIYQGKKLEPDLSLIRDEFSVRYECWQSLEIHVNFLKVNSGYSSACDFYIFYTFPSMLRRLPSGSVNKLSFKLSFFDSFLFYFNGLWRLNTD